MISPDKASKSVEWLLTEEDSKLSATASQQYIKEAVIKEDEGSSKEVQKQKTPPEAGENAGADESEEEQDLQEILTVNQNNTAGPDPPSLSLIVSGDPAEKAVGTEGVPDEDVDQTQARDKCNLIINYLPPTFTENDVMHYFSPYGVIQQCKVVMDLHTMKSKGYGFVKFADQKSAEKAMEALNGYAIDNKKLKVAVARKHCKEIRNSNLYVTHLPKTLDSKGLEELFKPHGKLVQCRVLTDKKGRYRGVGFVRFDTHESAMQAIQALNKTRPKGWQKEIRVKLASKRTDFHMMDWGPYSGAGMYPDWWTGFYPPSPSPRMLPPWGHTQSPRDPPFLNHHSSPRGRPGMRYFPPSPYGYPPHPGYSLPPYSPGPGWGPPPMSFWDHYGCSPRRNRRGGYHGEFRNSRRSSTAVVTNLAENVNESDLIDLFSELDIYSCKLERRKGRNKRAFINFNNHRSAVDACKFDGKVVKGKAMKIHLK